MVITGVNGQTFTGEKVIKGENGQTFTVYDDSPQIYIRKHIYTTDDDFSSEEFTFEDMTPDPTTIISAYIENTDAEGYADKIEADYYKKDAEEHTVVLGWNSATLSGVTLSTDGDTMFILIYLVDSVAPDNPPEDDTTEETTEETTENGETEGETTGDNEGENTGGTEETGGEGNSEEETT